MNPSQEASEMCSIPEPIKVTGIKVTPFDSYDHALRCVESVINQKSKTLWIAINPQKCYRAWHEPDLFKLLNSAGAGICDGVGVSLASRILSGKGINRITGCDLFFKLLARAEEKQWGVFMLGASDESNARAREAIQHKHPKLRIVGFQDGYFDDDKAVVEKINQSGANLLFAAMGSPKQEYWLSSHLKDLDISFCMGVGGSYDVASGTIKRAPIIFQKTGIEFLYQLITEPKRWKRQKVYFPYLMRILWARLSGKNESNQWLIA